MQCKTCNGTGWTDFRQTIYVYVGGFGILMDRDECPDCKPDDDAQEARD